MSGTCRNTLFHFCQLWAVKAKVLGVSSQQAAWLRQKDPLIIKGIYIGGSFWFSWEIAVLWLWVKLYNYLQQSLTWWTLQGHLCNLIQVKTDVLPTSQLQIHRKIWYPSWAFMTSTKLYCINKVVSSKQRCVIRMMVKS